MTAWNVAFMLLTLPGSETTPVSHEVSPSEQTDQQSEGTPFFAAASADWAAQLGITPVLVAMPVGDDASDFDDAIDVPLAYASEGEPGEETTDDGMLGAAMYESLAEDSSGQITPGTMQPQTYRNQAGMRMPRGAGGGSGGSGGGSPEPQSNAVYYLTSSTNPDTSNVPEPASLAIWLGAAGFGGLMARRRRQSPSR